MSNDNFLIEQEDINAAYSICSNITSRDIRNRAVANVLAAKIAGKYFQEANVDIESGIHNIVKVLEDIDISDIYIDGNRIDVRFYFDEDELFVPKSHFDMDILPTAYMFIKLEPDISKGIVAGFVLPEEIPTDTCINDLYKFDDSCLKSFYDVESRFVNVDDEEPEIDFEKDIYEFLNKRLSDKETFYKILFASYTARIRLANAAKANDLFSAIDDKLLNPADETTSETEFDANTDLTADEEITELREADNLEIIEPLDNEIFDSLEPLDGDSLDSIPFNESDLLTEVTPSEQGIEEYAPDLDVSVEENAENDEEPANEYEPLPEEDLSEADEFDEEIFEQAEQLPEENEAETPVDENLEEDIPSEISQGITDEDSLEDEISELSEFDYSTEIAPSISSIEASAEEQNEGIVPEDPEPESPDDNGQEEDVESAENIDEISEQEIAENEEQIDNLFGENTAEKTAVPKKKSAVAPLLSCLLVLGALGYFGYTKIFAPTNNIQDIPNQNPVSEDVTQNNPSEKSGELAMPLETVENNEVPKVDNQSVSIAIPAIEKNLNASIEVSNLSVNWEVPQSYTNNTTAKRYFVRIGKILQLNLKTELLLLSSPPITNKISLELEYNSNGDKFDIKQIVDSSGVKAVDDVIKDTVNKVLNMNLNTNMSVFKNLQGNPVLVIIL